MCVLLLDSAITLVFEAFGLPALLDRLFKLVNFCLLSFNGSLELSKKLLLLFYFLRVNI